MCRECNGGDKNNELASAANSYIDKESLTSPITSIISELCFIANESKLWISGGCVHTSVLPQSKKLDDDEHDKRKKIYHTHLMTMVKSNTTSPGTKLVVCNSSPIGTLGLSICYDMRFPEMYVDLVHRMGAQVLLNAECFYGTYW